MSVRDKIEADLDLQISKLETNLSVYAFRTEDIFELCTPIVSEKAKKALEIRCSKLILERDSFPTKKDEVLYAMEAVVQRLSLTPPLLLGALSIFGLATNVPVFDYVYDRVFDRVIFMGRLTTRERIFEAVVEVVDSIEKLCAQDFITGALVKLMLVKLTDSNKFAIVTYPSVTSAGFDWATERYQELGLFQEGGMVPELKGIDAISTI